ncbi:MAG: hypothetical protein HOM34_04250 [Planctomycetes bacterium]|jgi:CheY-like chemotaxis protein|nr:hypothetical protein [Planctomycetota bacterium]MBT4028944.1 hypothetical protein [Planctomycetota bacterium]MBT4560696.1 hypothetical protein [Planctomycetota bacterium]MBT5101151.1 hypothetical protein [Planctomycetota bacterium]MBT5119913.1 hypothetical protein [Planctomycetota bacterium]
MPSPLILHVLISEDFFQERVVATTLALDEVPQVAQFDGDILSAVRAEPGSGIVLDLEDEQFDSIEILKQIVKDEILAPLPLLTFCSPECEETLQKAAALGVVVTPRSTFASNIVGMIKALVQSEDPA